MKTTFTSKKVLGILPALLFGCLLTLSWSTTFAGGACENATQYPASAVTVDAGGSVTSISTLNYEEEYSVITGITSGNYYEVTSTNGGGYITVREGAANGTVLAQGFSPVQFTASSASDVYIHWTFDAACTTDGSTFITTTIQDLGTAPCDNSGADGQWPGSSIDMSSSTVGVAVNITTSQYAGSEFSVVTGLTAGNFYEVTHSNGSYITVREGAVDGLVLASGFSPVTFTSGSGADVYIHWNVDAACTTLGSGGGLYTTTITNQGLPPCENVSQWPGSAITPDAGGAVTTIANNLYAGSEYSVITGVLEGHEYEFEHANGSYITVRVGAVDGPVLGSGYSPLTVQTTGTDDLYVHWTVDDACATSASGSYLATVQDLGIPTCNNGPIGGAWPSSSVSVDGFALTEISGCNYEDEYSVVTGIATGAEYTLTSTGGGGYITVTVGAVDGPVLGAGYSPLVVTATGTDDLYVHWTFDEFCATVGTSPCVTTTIQRSCAADAGTSTADATPVCMSGGSATVSITPDGNQVIPTGYTSLALLADGSGNLLDAGSFSYTVNAAGTYYLHTAVVDPADLATYQTEATIAGIHGLTVDGGGTLCGSLDLTGVAIVVNEEPTATISGGGLSCGGATVDVEIDFTGTGPWSVNYTDPNGVVDLTGVTDNPLVISSSDEGSFTLNSVSDANCPGTVSGSAAITSGSDPLPDFTFGQVPGSLDVDFVDASGGTPLPSSWLWDFGDGNTSTSQDPTHTYASSGTYTVCLTVTNDCGSDSSCAAVTVADPPANDLCSGAETVNCGDVVTGDYIVATADNVSSDCGNTVGAGVWYVLAGTGELVTVSTCGSNPDTEISVYSGDCNTLTCVGSNDDDCGLQSTVSFVSMSGTNYYINVAHYADLAITDGAFSLSVTCEALPTNQNACGAEMLSTGANGPYAHSSFFTSSGWESTFVAPEVGCEEQGGWCLDLDIENSSYYSFVAPASGSVTVSTDGSTFDTQLAVLSGTCQDVEGGSGTIVGANDDDPDASGSGGTDLTSIVHLCDLTPGTTYYVLVDGWNGATGDLTVNLTENSLDADFTSTTTGLDVDFADASSTSGTIVSWEWDFDDGNTSTDQDPSHTYATDGTYNVCLTVTDNLGCTSTYCTDVVILPVSIAEAVESGMEVYPNPSNGQFVVEISGVEADVQLTLLDVAGRVVYTEGVVLNGNYRKELNVNVASGTYLLQVVTTEGLVTRKVQIH